MASILANELLFENLLRKPLKMHVGYPMKPPLRGPAPGETIVAYEVVEVRCFHVANTVKNLKI
jgi:hypothetical protein